MRRADDLLTLDLFEVPVPVRPTPGALAVGPALRGLLSDLLKRAPMSRHEVAARMSELTGDHISKHQLDSWTAESREGWRFPLEYLPAFEEAIHTHDVTAWVADLRGARLSVGREAAAWHEGWAAAEAGVMACPYLVGSDDECFRESWIGGYTDAMLMDSFRAGGRA